MANSSEILEIIRAIGLGMGEEKEHLTELDRPIGDSDHGINLARSFGAVEGKLNSLEDKDIGTILKMVGMTLVSTVGGTPGPLYGTAYMKTGMVLTGRGEMDITGFLAMIKAVVEGVMQRGHVMMKEATMLGAIILPPTVMETVVGEGKSTAEILGEGVRAAWIGAEHTKDLVITKGRANYVGERGLGHQDPGVTFYSCILETIARPVG